MTTQLQVFERRNSSVFGWNLLLLALVRTSRPSRSRFRARTLSIVMCRDCIVID